jgi:hypothetical protein
VKGLRPPELAFSVRLQKATLAYHTALRDYARLAREGLLGLAFYVSSRKMSCQAWRFP